MTTTLEKAVRAIREEDPNLTVDEAKSFVRAVLMAVREPDAGAVSAGMAAWPFEADAPATAVYRQHTAMIDHILSDKP